MLLQGQKGNENRRQVPVPTFLREEILFTYAKGTVKRKLY